MAQLENTFVKFNYCDKPGGFLVLNYSLLFFCFCFESFASCNGLFPLLDSYSDSDMDSCTMQDFSVGLFLLVLKRYNPYGLFPLPDFRFQLRLRFQTLWLHSIMQLTRIQTLIPLPNGYCTHFRDRFLSQGQISIPTAYI